MKAIRQCIERARKKDKNYDPQVVYLVARKKIDTRFFSEAPGAQTRGKFQQKVNNPVPGTVIFDEISAENAYDFHLAAQKVTQGTTTPTHYVIAYNSSKIPQEALAQLTYELCYSYYNWHGSVRVPACLQNANKLAKLVGENMGEQVTNPDMLKRPFYL